MATDQEIWTGIARGDAALFEALYREHSCGLKAFLHHILGNAQAAEDVTQETFTHIWRCPNGFDPERGTLRAYLFGIARKRGFEWWRHHKPTEDLEGDRLAQDDPESASIMGDALRRLPEEQRCLLWLREVEGHSYAELAATLGLPVGTVRSRLFAARIALRKIWFSKTFDNGGMHEL